MLKKRQNVRKFSDFFFKISIIFSFTGSDLVEAEKTGIKIVESPYVLSFKDMTKFFKPGLPFDFTVRPICLPKPDFFCFHFLLGQ